MPISQKIKCFIESKKASLKNRFKIKIYALLNKIYTPLLDELRKPIGGGE